MPVGSPMMHHGPGGLQARRRSGRAYGARRGSRPPRHGTWPGESGVSRPRSLELGYQGQGDGEKPLHVAGAATVEPTVLLGHDRTDRSIPVLAVDRDHVGMAGKTDAGSVLGARGSRRDWPLCRYRPGSRSSPHAVLGQVVAHRFHQRHVARPGWSYRSRPAAPASRTDLKGLLWTHHPHGATTRPIAWTIRA